MQGAPDALSALLIKQAGFKAYFIGEFPLVGVRYGVSDIGLVTLGEIAADVSEGPAVFSLALISF